ncbi:uncharacterized protein LOC120182918 [Hibiscus syriacus]|uniref:uncharacterized protein LOC120182918 n=1 Tax=Hibiscus syriacus TaxID=106335 RepID=UPI00192447D7|nr:uncharacterized protein LOC120182918 [Hibiscus syriacus]
MYGKAHASVITDQDLTIGAVIKKVFPESHHFSRLSSFAEKSEEIRKVIVRDLDQIYQKVPMMETQGIGIMENDSVSSQQLTSEDIHGVIANQPNDIASIINIGDPHVSQTKGRRKDSYGSQSERFKSCLEMALTRTNVKRRSCQICKGYDHNKRNCKGTKNFTNILSD